MSTPDLNDKYALSPAWEKGKDYKTPFDYTIEGSGQTVLIRRLDMGDLLKLGIAEQMDVMSKTLMADEDESQKDKDAKEIVNEAILKAGNFEGMERMINEICVAGIIKPKIQRVPEHEAARQPGQVYIDTIPFADRMELFSVIYDAEGLALFRAEQDNGLGNVANVPSVQLPPDGSMDVRPDDTQGLLLQSGSVPLGPDGRIRNEQSGERIETSEANGGFDRPASEHSEAGSSEPVLENGNQTVP